MAHGNVLSTASAAMTIVPGLGNQDVYLAYLPLAHILELAAENIIAAIGSSNGYGSPLALTDTSNKIKKGIKGDATILRPTLMAAVPAILDHVRDGVRKKKLVWGMGLEKLFLDLLVFRKVRAILGGQIRYLLSGGAPLSVLQLVKDTALLKPVQVGLLANVTIHLLVTLVPLYLALSSRWTREG